MAKLAISKHVLSPCCSPSRVSVTSSSTNELSTALCLPFALLDGLTGDEFALPVLLAAALIAALPDDKLDSAFFFDVDKADFDVEADAAV